MNKRDPYFRLLVLILVSIFVTSCVNDDSFFPDETGDRITTSVSMVTLLNDLGTQDVTTPEDQLCFRFVYPLVLGYNNDASIRVDDYEGLLSVIASQSINFNITGIQFPIEIQFNNGASDPIIIENENSLVNVLKEC